MALFILKYIYKIYIYIYIYIRILLLYSDITFLILFVEKNTQLFHFFTFVKKTNFNIAV